MALDFVVVAVDADFFFESDRPRRRGRDRLHRPRRRHDLFFERYRRCRRRRRRRLRVVTRLTCLGLPPRSVEAGRLEGPIWEVRKRLKSVPGLPGPEMAPI